MSRKSVYLVALVAILAIGGTISVNVSSKTTSGGPELVGNMAQFQPAKTLLVPPDISWSTLDGKPVALRDFKGKVVLLNYWATWCGPCMFELPGINRLQQTMASDKFTVVAINIDRNGTDVAEPKARELGLSALKLYVDPKQLSPRKLGMRGMPSTYLFDTKGRQIGKLEGGAEWDAPESVALLKYFIERPAYADQLPRTEG